MNKTLSLITASTIALGISGALFSSSVRAREIDCVNYWVNPERQAQCFDDRLNLIAVPYGYFSNTASSNNTDLLLRRRATGSQMVMPNLIGLKIDAAEDYLLDLGVTLGSEEVHAQNKMAGEIIQQNPLPGTELTKGQTVLLQYMGANVNPLQVK